MPAENGETCITRAASLAAAIDGSPFEREIGFLCDEEDTGFFRMRVRHPVTSNFPNGEPLVYFACTDRRGLTCVADDTIDKCYAGLGQRDASSTMYCDVSVAAIGPQNVEKLFSDYERINQITEAVLAKVSPATCKH